jgi:hypothetical protein
MEDRIASVARDVEPFLDEFIFMGGAVTALLVTDPAAVPVPVTDDVDVVVGVTTRAEYDRISERLRSLGLRHDTSQGAPICRWITPTDGYRLDVMPSEEGVLGFSNRWYDYVLATAGNHELPGGPTVMLASPVGHLATKLAAYRDRGAGDPLASRDLEDVVVLVAGRPEITGEVADAPPELVSWMADVVGGLLELDVVDYVLLGNLPDAATVPGLVEEVKVRLERIADLAD